MGILGGLIGAYVIGSVLEWAAHKYLMHRKDSPLKKVYKEHKIHHIAFPAGRFQLTPEYARKECFTLGEVLLTGFILLLLIVGIPLYPLNPPLILSLGAMAVAHRFLFDTVHDSLHVNNKKKWMPRWYFKLCAWNHLMHHRHPDKFFSLMYPGADWLFGSHCGMSSRDKREWERYKTRLGLAPQPKKGFECFQDRVSQILDKDHISKFSEIGYIEDRDAEMREIGLLSNKVICNLFVGDVRLKELYTLPENKPVIYAVNHSSWKDVAVIVSILPDARFMAAQSVMKFAWGLLGLYFGYFLGGFSVAPGKDGDASIDAGVKVIERGEDLIIFPEGWAYHDGKMREFRRGASEVQKRTGVEIIPIKLVYGKYPGSWINKFPFIIQCLITAAPLYRKDCYVIIGEHSKQLLTPGELREKINELTL